jgi:DNA-binding NtrC family response regulator
MTLSLSARGVDSKDSPVVLLVEDEPTLSRVLEHILTDAGYDVILCANGLDALGLVACGDTTVDVVVSDVGLPGLRGDKLAGALRQLRPALPIVLMTGYSAVVAPGHEDALGVAAILEKPITIEDLLAAVRDALRLGAART